MDKSNIELLNETVKIINTGRYFSEKRRTFFNRPVKIPLKLTGQQMSEAIVITDKQIQELVNNPPYNEPVLSDARCRFTVSNNDSFASAIKISGDYCYKKEDGKILVLNFANPVEPGGGVRRGAKAQEEDLCRKSTWSYSNRALLIIKMS